MMRIFLNRWIVLLILLVGIPSCMRLDEEDFVGVYVNEYDMNKGITNSIILNQDGTTIHYYEGNTITGTWEVECSYYSFFSYQGEVEDAFVRMDGKYMDFNEDESDDDFTRIDTIMAFALKILPAKFETRLFIKPYKIETVITNATSSIDTSYLLSHSHIALGYILTPSFDKRNYTANIDVGINGHDYTRYKISRFNEAFYDVFEKLNRDDTVIVMVSDSLPGINRVVNWFPTRKEINAVKKDSL